MKNIKNADEYFSEFKSKNSENDSYNDALKSAYDIRKFELEMYWKRTAYFWTLTGVALAGYISIISGNGDDESKEVFGFLVNCIGLVFSFGWYLVNRGSKYWQKNWESHVDILEEKKVGSLYKMNLNPSQFKFINLSGAYRFSVSRTNQILSLFIVTIWLYLFVSNLISNFSIDCKFIFILLITIFFIIYLILGTRIKSPIPNQKVDFVLREYE